MIEHSGGFEALIRVACPCFNYLTPIYLLLSANSIELGMATTYKLVLGSVAFLVFWVMVVFPSVPLLPIGRTAGSLLGAMLMVLFQVITPEIAYDSIDLPILGLLFGTMVVSVYLQRADLFKHLGSLLYWKCRGSKDLLCRICFISAVSSAVFTNDTSCVVLTEFVLKLARERNLPPHPFLLALASSANIGSSATPIGNPQNLVIAIRSKISFGNFLVGLAPAMLVGIVVNALIIVCMYWKLLSDQKDQVDLSVEVASPNAINSYRFSPPTASATPQELTSSVEICDNQIESVRNRAPSSEKRFHGDKEAVDDLEIQHSTSPTAVASVHVPEQEDLRSKWKGIAWKTCVYLVTLGMLVSLIVGLDMSWTAITAALTLIVLDFKDGKPSLDKVSYSILIFFCGMFITISGFNHTGIPSAIWGIMEPYSKIDRASGTTVLAVVILLLSNVASNVPTVLLLGGRVAASAAAISTREEKRAWLLLAWISTVAGNLSLFGSAANLIVCEQARQPQHLGYTLTFWKHLKFGVPSTLIVTAIGLTLIR